MRAQTFSLRFVFVAFALGAVAWGAPKLRLSTATVGPVSIAASSTNATQIVEAFNTGDGALNLRLSSTAAWLTPQLGTARACTPPRTGNCLPITMSINSTGVTGTQTALVTVSDPNAWDAPQTITVTIQVGGALPDSLVLHVPPGGRAERAFTPAAAVRTTTNTTSGGGWLNIVADGGGTFAFSRTFSVAAQASTQPDGTYNGTVAVSGSTFAGENKTMNVQMVVTRQPIAVASPTPMFLKYPRGFTPPKSYISVANTGQGNLTIGAVTASASWSRAAVLAGTRLIEITLDTAALAEGTYTTTIGATGNWVNGAISVPVTVEIVAPSGPQISFGGIVNNANFGAAEPLAPGGLAVLFGNQLSLRSAATDVTWPAGLDGIGVYVNGAAAPLYYTSFGQINFQIPYSTTAGEASVVVVRDGVIGNVNTVNIQANVPRIMVWPGLDYGIIVNNDGSVPVPASANFVSVFTQRPARPGDYLVAYVLGMGQTSPPVSSGAPAPAAEPLARVGGNTVVRIGETTVVGRPIDVTPLFVGLTPTFVGLYQVNFQLPPTTPRGERVRLRIDSNGASSNSVFLAIQ